MNMSASHECTATAEPPHLLFRGTNATDKHIGQKLRELRNRHKLSLQQLAGKFGIAYQQLQKYETGANRISARALYVMACYFKVPVSYFYEGLPPSADEPTSASMSAAANAKVESALVALASARKASDEAYQAARRAVGELLMMRPSELWPQSKIPAP